ncbi:unnamed protein product [Spirodela intermedia]|uniref:DUF4057 domain-containing protein n=1 Tax=Spirodela intermedia TaxID=51605 RepID=A0A7I8J2F7_SPIIN|nr:unnamed protein product [Spirodela intermedia]CAA6664406.1 unnamed protein product [Spirodela intermedia]
MERSTPVRKSHTSTADLLTWTENPQQGNPAADSPGSRSGIRTPGGIRSVLFGGEMTEEEAEALLLRKQCSGSKWKEMTGSGIFAGENGDESTGQQVYQQAASAISQISFSAEESVSPKKPATLTEVAKQRELSGTLERESDAKLKKQISDAKSKELTARILEKESKDVGAPAPRTIHTSVKVSNQHRAHRRPVMKTSKKIHNQKFAELSGNNIFEGDAPQAASDKPLSTAKLREMSGSNIFADGKSTAREYYGGIRRPPAERAAYPWSDLPYPLASA